jgi:hypothetical protein
VAERFRKYRGAAACCGPDLIFGHLTFLSCAGGGP